MTNMLSASRRRVRQTALVCAAVALLLSASSNVRAQSAWGGGCGTDGGAQACIALIWPTLYISYYFQQDPGVQAYTATNVCQIGAGCTFLGYGFVQSFYGYFPHDISGDGSAYAEMWIVNASTHYPIAVRYSPVQYWDD